MTTPPSRPPRPWNGEGESKRRIKNGEGEALRAVPLLCAEGGEKERRLLLSWAKAGKDSKESREATRSEGDDLEESAARAIMRHQGRGRGVRG